tara:strand:+ start:142 stop:396 length:255 start_codon:yes stop_codon:yes gene_type:complete
LRDSHYSGAQDLGHGEDYVYPHSSEAGWVEQQYLPDDITGHRYYSPSLHGFEAEIVQRLADQQGAADSRRDPMTSDEGAKDQKT